MGIYEEQAPQMTAYEAALGPVPRGRAVVLGGGLSGLLAARALADTFEEVIVIERHSSPAVRPVQGQALSEAARHQLDGLFPGLSSELVADGAAIAVPPSGARPTSAFGAERAGARLQFTERFIQPYLYRRINSLDGVVMLNACDALGLISDRQRCVGVHILQRSRSAAARTIPAELVVDAMGAASRLCLWMEELWRIHIPCDRQVITQYASRLYQPRGDPRMPSRIIDLRPAHPYRTAITAVENDHYVVTVAGPSSPRVDAEQFDQLLRDLLPQHVAAAVVASRPAGPVIISASAQIRRHFDQAERLPSNVIALGDSLCSCDPLVGRGFEVAILEASVLSQLLCEPHLYADNGQPSELPRRYFRAAATIVDGEWVLGA